MDLDLTSKIKLPVYQLRSEVINLCRQTGKPVLKLSTKDYLEHDMGHWVEQYGSAGLVNIEVFNQLQHTITGWPGGKPNADDTNRPERATPYPKRIIVFSPHPDDDVISMGGTIRRLVQQEHDVHIAYQTSGNIAVDDEEYQRFMRFLEGYGALIRQDIPTDSISLLAVKALIRRGEARLACAYNGIPDDNVHFLNLPFYESGTIEKLPMTERDVVPIQQLIADIKPHQIYVAGDLADPHGTHKKCTDAVLAAIDEERQAGASWLDDCRVWMYRGAWAEWEVANIEMCVPMSPEELREKRNAILKHQSQMESAPFLGNDERLFWQRAEDRNRATAKRYDDLGLACYEAMEAFVEYRF